MTLNVYSKAEILKTFIFGKVSRFSNSSNRYASLSQKCRIQYSRILDYIGTLQNKAQTEMFCLDIAHH